MFRHPKKKTRQSRSRIRPQRHLSVEPLESRVMLSADGLLLSGMATSETTLAVNSELTISFAPDGTDVAGHASELFAELQTPQTQGWQQAIANAFATWTAYTSTNVTIVRDNGDPLGTPGPAIGDDRFGDVRVAAIPLATDTIAMSVPQDELASGTWAGDILINSQYDFANVDELFAVAVHEAGHVLGLGHSDNPDSPMFIHGIPDTVTPLPEDIAQLRQASGFTPPQELDQPTDHDDDTDHNNANTYDTQEHRDTERDRDEEDERDKEDEREAREANAAREQDERQRERTETNRVTEQRKWQNERLRRLRESGEGEGEGEGEEQAADEIVTAIRSGNSQGEQTRNDKAPRELTSSRQLRRSAPTDIAIISADTNRPLHFGATGVIRSSQDSNDFLLASSGVEDDTFDFLTITIRSANRWSRTPRLEVLSEHGELLEFEVLANADGTLVVQLGGVRPSDNYVVRVMAAKGVGLFPSGEYELEAQFVNQQTALAPLFSQTLHAGRPVIENSFHVGETTLAQLVLTVDTVDTANSVAMWTVIYDHAGDIVQRIGAFTGETRSSGTLLLAPGDYRVRFQAAQPAGKDLPEIQFKLAGKAISLPIGPTIQDPTKTPILPPANDTLGPKYWDPRDLVVTDPIIFPSPTNISPPNPTVIADPSWYASSLWYWEQPTLVNIGVR